MYGCRVYEAVRYILQADRTVFGIAEQTTSYAVCDIRFCAIYDPFPLFPIIPAEITNVNKKRVWKAGF